MTPEELKTSPKYAAIRGLLDGTLPSDENLGACGIHTSVSDLGPETWGVVYRCKNGHFHVVVNECLSPEVRKQVLFHELRHIIEDEPTLRCTVGMDKQYEILERQADMMVKEVAAAAAGK